jgi:hypothetical protein
MILQTEGGNSLANSEAHDIMTLLTQAYPGHPWAVRVDQGVIFIRYLDPLLSGNWGMCIRKKDTDHDAAVLKKKVIMAAGEWLERAGLKRGRENGDEILRVDGVPFKYHRKPLEITPVG